MLAAMVIETNEARDFGETAEKNAEIAESSKQAELMRGRFRTFAPGRLRSAGRLGNQQPSILPR